MALILGACTDPVDKTSPAVESPAPASAPTTSAEVESITTAPPGDVDYFDYIETVLSVMERSYYATDEVDWEALRQSVVGGLSDEPSSGEAYDAIQQALRLELRDPHSYFLRPRIVEDLRTLTTATPEPAGERIGDVGYLVLPGVAPWSIDPEHPSFYADRVNHLLAELDTPEPVCGWIVDLRENGGGTIGPMFASLGPLLGEGVALTDAGPTGTQTITVGDDLQVSYDFDRDDGDLTEEFPLLIDSTIRQAEALSMAASTPSGPLHRPGVGDPPVAVLTSNTTGSAAEYVTIAFLGREDTRTFGDLTAGVPTGIRGYELADGGILGLATVVPSDRQGRSYETHIQPHELIPFSPPDEDRPLDAALEWLASQPSCE